MSTSTPFSLTGKCALVTGGGTGIGLAIAKAFVAAGATIIMTGRREEVLRNACVEIGESASYRVCDVADAEAVTALIASIEEGDGIALDILVNNAGENLKKPTVDLTDEEFERVVRVNLNGVFTVTREAIRRMLPRGRGVILNIGSMAAIYGLPKVAAYTAAKTAVVGLTRSLATELGASGLRVNTISPGFIYSEMTAKTLDSDPERKRRVFERTPMGRMGEASEIGTAAVFLCSDAASFITGVELPVDGGNSIGF